MDVCTSSCGDGKLMTGEVCDDGNSTDNIGCLNDCSGIIKGYSCTAGTTSSPNVCSSICGDGLVL